LLEAIAVIATYTRNNKDRAALLRHADMIKRGSGGCRRSWIERMWRSTTKQQVGHYSNETRTVT